MSFYDEIRAALIAYREAHLAWRDEPEGIFVDQKQEWLGTTKTAAKRARGQAHGKLLELAELIAQREK